MDISGFFEVIEEGPEASEEYYKKWVENVKANVPKERLLVFDVKQARTDTVKKLFSNFQWTNSLRC